MTTEWVVMLGLVGCGGGTTSQLDPGPSAAPTLRASCELATHRCSRCHPIERVLVTTVRDRHAWESYVERMRLMPGSGISIEDAPRITNCLVRWSSEESR